MAEPLELPVNLQSLEDLKKFEGCLIRNVVITREGGVPELHLDLSNPGWDMMMRLTIYPSVAPGMAGNVATFTPALKFKHNAVVARP